MGTSVWRGRRVSTLYTRAPARRTTIPLVVSAELVNNWWWLLNADTSARARPGNCLISWVRAPIRQPDVTGTWLHGIPWLLMSSVSKENAGYIGVSRGAYIRLDRETDGYIRRSCSLKWISVRVEHRRRRDTRDSRARSNCPRSIRVYIGSGYALLVRLIAISWMFLTVAARTDVASATVSARLFSMMNRMSSWLGP